MMVWQETIVAGFYAAIVLAFRVWWTYGRKVGR